MTLTIRIYTPHRKDVFRVLDSLLSDAWHVVDFYTVPRRLGGYYHYVTLQG